jgi:hypothetical protein
MNMNVLRISKNGISRVPAYSVFLISGILITPYCSEILNRGDLIFINFIFTFQKRIEKVAHDNIQVQIVQS